MDEPGKHRSLFQRIRNWLRRGRKPESPPPDLSERLVPVRRGPRGRSGAAVAEPEEDSFDSYPPRRA
jgi:hypothetical protein